MCERQMSKNKTPQIPRVLRCFVRDLRKFVDFFLSRGGMTVRGRKVAYAEMRLIFAPKLGIAIYTLSPRV